MLTVVGLADSGTQAVRKYSQGMRQRLGIARVLLGDPAVLIFDEPTNGLDPLGIFWARTFVRDLASQGKAIIITSHLLHEVQAIADQVLLLNEGRALAHGSAASIIGAHETLEALYVALLAHR